MGVQFRLLGGVEVHAEAHTVNIGHARQQSVLVVLLIEANHPVSADQLIDRVWGTRPPHRARETLYNYLSRLRRALGPLPAVDLIHQPRGYVLTTDPMAVDLHRFSHLIVQARATQDTDQTLALFEQALALWREDPFTGLDTPWLNAQREALQRDRFAVSLDCTDLQLRRGEHGWLLGELATRARAHPLDERVAGQLMLAQYQSGRQADALDHFQQLRTHLAEELGIDPGPGLRQLYEQILTTDPTLAAPTPPGTAARSAPTPVARQLPAHIPHFVGRAAELRQLTSLLTETTSGGGTVVITAIDGTAGIGKTALALHWAHQAAERFPDGQLYVNLRGFDPTNTPLHPADALRGFLDALEIPAERIPASVDAQAGLYRSLLADRQVLVVLDNARDAEQVRPLLPASPGCLVVITSRNQLTGLIAHERAHPITLDVLTAPEARALLTSYLGPARINAEPHTVTELIDYCARLPLALAIMAARAVTHPGFALRVLAKDLAEEHTRLDALDTGEPTTNIRAVFSWSYRQLSTSAARMFRLLGLRPGPDIALPAAARLADLPSPQARDALTELTRAHLLTQRTPGRYTFHDLLRAYAIDLATTHDSRQDQRAALTRLFNHYLETTTAVTHFLYPAEHPDRPDPSPSAIPATFVTDPATAQAWLDTEWTNLTAIIAHAAEYGWHTHATQLANLVLIRDLEIGSPHHVSHYGDALAVYMHARHAARQTKDRITEAWALLGVGHVYWHQGHLQQAADYYQQALILCRDISYRMGEAIALNNFAILHWHQGDLPQAIELHEQALAICREVGYRAGEALALIYLGVVCWQQGHSRQATEYHEQALAICREVGYRAGEALALSFLGHFTGWQQGHYRQAIDYYHQALPICREVGYRAGEAVVLILLADVCWQQGHYRQATEHYEQGLAISRKVGYRQGEVLALNGLGLVNCQEGHYQQAVEHYQQALTVGRDISYRIGEINVLTNRGIVDCQQGNHQDAAKYHQRALAISRDINARCVEPRILNGLGETHHGMGQLGQAHTYHTAALTLATELGHRYEQARAHHGLARAYHSTGDPDHARHHWHQALALFTELGVPDSDDVRTHLARLEQTR